jgi:hypothetical protein
LWRNRQIEACLILRPKPRNCHGDFKTQIIKPYLPVLRPKPKKPSTTLVLRLNQKIIVTDFEAKPKKPSPSVLRPNRRKLFQWF